MKDTPGMANTTSSEIPEGVEFAVSTSTVESLSSSIAEPDDPDEENIKQNQHIRSNIVMEWWRKLDRF